jgi:hypothetical protein
MANTVTVLASVSEEPTRKKLVLENKVVLDTANSDTIVHTPATGFGVYLRGWVGAEATALTLQLKQRSVAAMTGTVATTNGSTSIFGTGTAFDTEYVVGDEMVITSGSTIILSTIAGPSTATAVTSASSTVTGKAHNRQQTFINAELVSGEKTTEPVKWRSWLVATKENYSLVVNTSALTTAMTILLHTQEGETE